MRKTLNKNVPREIYEYFANNEEKKYTVDRHKYNLQRIKYSGVEQE